MLVRYEAPAGESWGVLEDGSVFPLDRDLAALLREPLDKSRALLARRDGAPLALDELRLLAPVDRQEIWAAGVTYERSRAGRVEESGERDLYDHVYRSDRPELFFKCTAERAVGEGEAIGIRADSTWDVPEPEVGLVLTSRLELFGFTIGDDVSSRSIEGDNALYLPQAKVYERSCAIGPAIVPRWAVGDGPFEIELEIERDGTVAFQESTSTARMKRGFDELARWLGRALSFPHGALLLTGTGIVPASSFTLRAGDTVTVRVPGLGELRNPVITIGGT